MVLQLAAEEESPDAQYALAMLLHTGEPLFQLARDPAAELQLLRSAREMGYTRALDRLGQLLETGTDVLPADADAAMRHYQESGSAFAQARLRALRATAGPSQRRDSISHGRSAPPPAPRVRQAPPTDYGRWWMAGSVGLVAVVGVAAFAFVKSRSSE